MNSYVRRPAIDEAIALRLQRGSGVFTLEGPAGAGKSATLLHALEAEAERRRDGYVRLVQLFGDEPPSLLARRLLREATHLHLVSYPQPQKLAALVEGMGQSVPGLSGAGKLLTALVPDDLRPLHQVARAALADAGTRALAQGGPLLIGVDLLGGRPAAATRDFFALLVESLPPSVVLLVAQPGGPDSLVTVPERDRVLFGPWSEAEARAYLKDLLGDAGPEPEIFRWVEAGAVSLLPGDLVQLVDLGRYLPAGRWQEVRELHARGVVARYQALYESRAERPGNEARAAELCAWVAVAARAERPLTAAQARRLLGPGPDGEEEQPTGLWRLRRSALVQSLCATAIAPGGPSLDIDIDLDSGWPLVPRHEQARCAVQAALQRHGVLGLYRRRFIMELRDELRRDPGAAGLLAGVQAVPALLDAAAEEPAALGEAVELMEELELPLWRAGWHHTFAELYDVLLPPLSAAAVAPRDVAPLLWFRRARARVQAVDWAASGQPLADELAAALRDLGALLPLSAAEVLQARRAVGARVDVEQVEAWCRHLPAKARQARGYARLLLPLGAREARLALDDILRALSHFAALGPGEDLAQTLTILGDFYSRAPAADPESADAEALYHYERAIATAQGLRSPPAFSLGVIYRSLGRHHERRGRAAEAAQAYGQARRFLLGGTRSGMGSLLAGLLASPAASAP